MSTTSSTGHEARCLRPGCGRKLTSAESVARRMGPTCYRKDQAERAELVAKAKEGFTADQVAKAEAAIAAGDVTQQAPGLYLVKSSRNGDLYATDGVSCTCPAGARTHSRRCWHLLAARIFEILHRPVKPVRPLALAA